MNFFLTLGVCAVFVYIGYRYDRAYQEAQRIPEWEPRSRWHGWPPLPSNQGRALGTLIAFEANVN